jgi:hypothetical protein
VEILVCGIFVLKEKLVNKMLILCEENQKKPHFNPFISNPGVKKPLNTVNMPKPPLYFHSSHDYLITKGLNLEVRC